MPSFGNFSLHIAHTIRWGVRKKIVRGTTLVKYCSHDSAGLSYKAIERQLESSESMKAETNTVRDRPRSGKLRATSQREDRALYRLERRQRFSTSTHQRHLWLPNRTLSTRTSRNCSRATGLIARRVIKRPLITKRYTCSMYILAGVEPERIGIWGLHLSFVCC